MRVRCALTVARGASALGRCHSNSNVGKLPSQAGTLFTHIVEGAVLRVQARWTSEALRQHRFHHWAQIAAMRAVKPEPMQARIGVAIAGKRQTAMDADVVDELLRHPMRLGHLPLIAHLLAIA